MFRLILGENKLFGRWGRPNQFHAHTRKERYVRIFEAVRKIAG